MKIFGAAIAVLLAPHFAHASCGLVDVSKGDVKILSANGTQAAAPQGTKVCSGDTLTAGADSRAKLKMEDGNELNISPDSKIVLENYQFNAAENKKKVLLNVLSGKVRATTKKENMYNDKAADGQANTFQVRTKSAVAGVRGTDFLTGFDPKTQKSEVVTFRGKVEVSQVNASGVVSSSTFVNAGQKTEVKSGQAPEAPRPVPAAELAKVNTETKGDAGTTPRTEPTSAPPPAKESPKSESNRAPTSVNPVAAPNAMTPPTSAISMGPPPADTIVVAPRVPVLPQIPALPPQVNDAVQKGNAKVIIKVNRGT